MRGAQGDVRRHDRNAGARASAIAKVAAAEQERRQAALRDDLRPGKRFSSPVVTLGHHVQRAIAENA